MKRLVLELAIIAVSFPSLAHAHQKSVSYSTWTLEEDGRAVARAKVRWFDLTSLPIVQQAKGGLSATTVAPYLQDHLLLETRTGPCVPARTDTTVLPSERGWLRLEWIVECDEPPIALRSDLFQSLANHVHLATVDGPYGGDFVLSSTSPRALLGPGNRAETGASIVDYMRLGIEHILSGWDHLAFLFLLIVIASRLREVVLLVTGFTVGHSLTLAAAALGAVVPNPRAVESVIAASILVVALENANAERSSSGGVVIVAALALFVASAVFGGVPAFWGVALFTACYFGLLRTFQGAGRLRWVIACLFGLVHGLGFSSVLLEKELPRSELVQALLGFNLGVELGQLAIVVAIWPMLQWLRRQDLGRPVVEWTSFAGAALGTFALVLRVFGT